MHSRENGKREVGAVDIGHFSKEFCHEVKEKKIDTRRGGSGIKRGFVCFIEDEKITACLPTDGNDPGGMEKLIEKKEAELLEQSQ